MHLLPSSRLAGLGLLLLFATAPGALAAQEPATLDGRVVGPDGSLLPEAAVSVLDEGGETVARTSTDARGTYSVELAPGSYQLLAEGSGYEPTVREITLAAGEEIALDLTLEPKPFEEAVTVTAPAYLATSGTTATKVDEPLVSTPQSLSIVTREQMDVLESGRLAEALRYTPGVQGEPFGFEPRFTLPKLRGFSAFTTGLYRDGLQLRNPGFAVGYDVEPYGAEQIAVLRGPASVLYGAGSPGGLVNVISKRPTLGTLREVELEQGSFDRTQAKVDLAGPLDDGGALSYRLTGLVRESDTQVDFVPNDRVYVAPAVTWRPGERTELTLLAHYQEDESRSSQALPAAGTLRANPNGEIPVERFTGEPDVDRYDRREISVAYLFEHRFGDTWTVRQNARYYDSDLDDVTVFSAALRPDGRTLDRFVFGSFGDLEGLAVDTHAQAELGTGAVRHRLLGGVDYQQVEAASLQSFGLAPPLDLFDPDYGAPVPEPPPFKDAVTEQEQVGLYLQDKIELGERWIVQLGARYDQADEDSREAVFGGRSDQDDDELTTRAGVVYLADNGFAPYVSYAESFLPVVGTDSAGEPFAPETGEQIEAGLKYQPPRARSFVTLALFELTRQNVLQFDPATFLPLQTGEIRSRGLELEGAASLAPGVDLIGSYTYLDAEITESNVAAEVGERPTQVPEHAGSLWGDYRFRGGLLGGLELGAGVRFLGSTYGDLPNTLEAPDTTLVDATVQYDWQGWRLAVNANNLFDEEFVASCFVRGGDFCTFGATRTVTASLRYRW